VAGPVARAVAVVQQPTLVAAGNDREGRHPLVHVLEEGQGDERRHVGVGMERDVLVQLAVNETMPTRRPVSITDRRAAHAAHAAHAD
jgi:hypothetical protein